MEIELSIIIPVYNVAPYIRQCIESITDNVSGYQVEVILVDDGSTDQSGELADSYARIYPCIQVIHRQNAGVAAARNAGISLAKGKWLYFMDSDDWLAKDGLALLHRAIRNNSEADMILLDAYQNDVKEHIWEHFVHAAIWTEREELLKLQRCMLYYPMDYPAADVSFAAPWDKVYNRAFLVKHGLMFREQLRVLDDMIFNMEVFGCTDKVVYEKYKVYHYRHVRDSITNQYKEDRVRQDRKVWRFIEQYRTQKIMSGLWEKEDAELFDQAYYCRIIRSFAICCRLNFYHPNNNRTHKKKQAYVKAVLSKRPYEEAFRKVRLRNLEWKLRIVVLMVRGGLYRGLYLLHLAENTLSIWSIPEKLQNGICN